MMDARSSPLNPFVPSPRDGVAGIVAGAGWIAREATVAARRSPSAPPDPAAHPKPALEVLARLGIAGLHGHQDRFLRRAVAGGSRAVAWGPRSGKSTVLAAAVAHALAGEKPGRVLVVFPDRTSLQGAWFLWSAALAAFSPRLVHEESADEPGCLLMTVATADAILARHQMNASRAFGSPPDLLVLEDAQRALAAETARLARVVGALVGGDGIAEKPRILASTTRAGDIPVLRALCDQPLACHRHDRGDRPGVVLHACVPGPQVRPCDGEANLLPALAAAGACVLRSDDRSAWECEIPFAGLDGRSLVLSGAPRDRGTMEHALALAGRCGDGHLWLIAGDDARSRRIFARPETLLDLPPGTAPARARRRAGPPRPPRLDRALHLVLHPVLAPEAMAEVSENRLGFEIFPGAMIQAGGSGHRVVEIRPDAGWIRMRPESGPTVRPILLPIEAVVDPATLDGVRRRPDGAWNGYATVKFVIRVVGFEQTTHGRATRVAYPAPPSTGIAQSSPVFLHAWRTEAAVFGHPGLTGAGGERLAHLAGLFREVLLDMGRADGRLLGAAAGRLPEASGERAAGGPVIALFDRRPGGDGIPPAGFETLRRGALARADEDLASLLRHLAPPRRSSD